MAEAKEIKGKLPKGRHRDQIKRQKQNLIRAERNRGLRSEIRTFIKKVREAVAKKDLALAKAAFVAAARNINKAASRGILHRNNASRKISRLAHAISTLGK